MNRRLTPSFSDYSRRKFLKQGSVMLAPLAATGLGSALIACADPSTGSSQPKASPALVFDPAQIGFGINHYLVTGQSLAGGEQGFFGISNTQPFNNRMFGPSDIFNYATLGANIVEFVPLISGSQSRETLGNGFADSLTAQARAILPETLGGPTSYDILITNSGVPGFVYQQLAGPTDWNPSNPYWAAAGGGTAGSPPFQEMMSQVAYGMSLAKAFGVSYRVAAMIVIHGDFDNANPYYDIDLAHWQSDTQKGAFALTGQSGTLPMIAAQTQADLGTANFSIGGGAGLYQAAEANPSLIFIGCAEYALMHHVAGEVIDGQSTLTVHLTADGYRHLGLMMAKAARVITMEGGTWTGLKPKSFSFTGNKVTVEHYVPYPPLVLDTDWVSDPGNKGYSWLDNVDPTITVVDVEVSSPTEVTVTLSAPTTGGMLGYGNFAPATDPSYVASIEYTTDFGPKFGARGCLRDSDPAVAYYTPSIEYYIPSAGGTNHYPMQNYCVRYQQRVGSCIGAQPDSGKPSSNTRC